MSIFKFLKKRKPKRIATVQRRTTETDIKIKLNIDGSGKTKINTCIGLLDHMLELFAFHGYFDLEITARGDLNVDMHHTNEDIGIVLGQVFKKALGTKEGISRNGQSSFPMEEVVANIAVDISGRGFFKFCGVEGKDAGGTIAMGDQKGYELNDATHFFDAFAKNLGMTLSITVSPTNPDLHTTLEPVFKALGKALDQATQVDPRRKGIPSTKGMID